MEVDCEEGIDEQVDQPVRYRERMAIQDIPIPGWCLEVGHAHFGWVDKNLDRIVMVNMYAHDHRLHKTQVLMVPGIHLSFR